MTSAERRIEIVKILSDSSEPVPAKVLAARFNVSRQAIVQDLAVIKASTSGIAATARGYVLWKEKDGGIEKEFKVRHGRDKVMEELNAIVDCGGRVKNVSISHRVYGRITVDMDIRSRQDVEDYLSELEGSKSGLLGQATSGYQYHLVQADSRERLDLIEKKLQAAGILAPLRDWEKGGLREVKR